MSFPYTVDQNGTFLVCTITKRDYEEREVEPVHFVAHEPCTYGGDW